MAFFKNIKYLILGSIFLFNASSTVLAAPKYVDISKDHWAYESIMKMAEKGYIVGNTNGEYKGNNPIDKFETAKILSMIAGYKYIDIKQEEKEFYDRSYNKHKNLLEKYRNKFSRWNTTADREISFLLEKKILIEEDLEHFIILSDKKQEQLRALSRQEAAVFLTRLINKDEEAIKNKYDKLFLDDQNIDKDKKPYIYFLKELGVISGDNSNNFVPNGPVTKAAFAVMLDKSLNIINKETNNSNNNILVETIVGKVENIYPSIKSIQILLNNKEIKIYKIGDRANIYLNDTITNFENIKKDMTVIGTVSNNELIDIRLKPEIEKDKGKEDIEKPEKEEINNNKNKEEDTHIEDDKEYFVIDGTVSYISRENNKNYIGIEIKIINPTGGILNQVIKYTLDKDAKIYKGDKNIKFFDIEEGNIIKSKLRDNKIYSIDILEKDRKLQGIIKEKGQKGLSKEKYYIVTDKKGNDYEFNVLNDTILERQGQGKVTFDKIKIGDTVDIVAEYTNLLELYAYGNKKIIEGTLEEVYMTQVLTHIKIKDIDGNIETFYITNKNIDIFGIKLGDKLKINVDSKEVEDLFNIKNDINYTIKGKLDYISGNKIIIEELDTNKLKTIYYDRNTNIRDYKTKEKVYLDDLKYNTLLYIYLDKDCLDYAKNIDVLYKY